jgi:hypothetical protein
MNKKKQSPQTTEAEQLPKMQRELPSPRELMRARHPDLFSDSEVEASPVLAKSVFEYHLDTLTSRKQEYEFEHFCRKLAEREVCPNLRVQTGPTGGGDSKVDSETYPVADEISERWWVGEPSGGSQRWGFAFSAKKAWKPKVRADVASVVSTGRDYKRIYFFTNQFVSDKDRAKLEDELSKSARLPVHIVDRSWIVASVYERGNLAVAISALGIESGGVESHRQLGAKDTARLAELTALDLQIADQNRYNGARFQLAEDCLRGAVLARGLDRPRVEVDGRFAQAERLAKSIGISQQLMRVAYSRAWTAHWWYEDYTAFLQFYSEVEGYLEHSAEADDVERLVNLWNLLITAESLDHIDKEVAQSGGRRAKLIEMLGAIASDASRPNNSLQARTALLLMQATDAMRSDSFEVLNAVWTNLAKIVDESSTMGQYPVERLANMVHELGVFADSAAFDALCEKVIDATRQRKSDGAAGIAYRDRGLQKLSHDRPYEAIRWIGRAEELLVKEEYQDDLVLTLVAGSFAYERAGLLWAARNKILVAAERSLHSFARNGEMPPSTLGSLQRLAWIELQIGRVPQVLQAMSWAAFVSRQLKLSEARQASYADEVQMQEGVMGIHFLNLSQEMLPYVEQLPDALERLGLNNARLALLFVLGHEKRIKTEGYFEPEKSSEELQQFFEGWQDQPAASDIPSLPTLNGGPKTSLRSVILGAEFVVVTPTNPTLVGVAESLLGALEAFLATTDEHDLLPHVERTTITVRSAVDSSTFPIFSFVGDGAAEAEISCPPTLHFPNSGAIRGFGDWLSDTVIKIAAHSFMVRDAQSWLERVAGDERAFARAVLLGDALTIGRNAFGYDPAVRLADWFKPDDKSYEYLRTRPWRVKTVSTGSPQHSTEPPKFGDGEPSTEMLDNSRKKHTDRQVLSPIDIPIWNQAGWGGTLFAKTNQPHPILGLAFRNLQAGVSIFSGWRAKWGSKDLQDTLRVVIVTGVSARSPAHYSVLIGSHLPRGSEHKGKMFVSVSRINRMTPESPTNLNLFLTHFQRCGSYLLVPADMGAPPKIEMTCYLAKRHLHVRAAWEIGENDPDSCALFDDDDPVIPQGVVDPPVKKTLERLRARRRLE